MVTVFSFLNVPYKAFNRMQRLFRAGWSANRVQTFMSGIGPGFRRSTVQAVRPKVLSLVKHEAAVKRLDKSVLPDKYHMTEMTWQDPSKYKYYGTVDLYNAETGELIPQDVSMFSEIRRSVDEIVNELYAKLDTEKYKETDSFQNLTIRQIQHKEGSPY